MDKIMNELATMREDSAVSAETGNYRGEAGYSSCNLDRFSHHDEAFPVKQTGAGV